MNISRTCKTLIILFAQLRKDAGPLANVFGHIKKKKGIAINTVNRTGGDKLCKLLLAL